MDEAEKIYRNILEKGFRGLNAFIENNQEETNYIDFITKQRPNSGKFDVDDKKNYSKALSGFGNAKGGIVIWGIYSKSGKEEFDPDVAKSKKPIIHLKKFITDLNHNCGQLVDPVFHSIENKPIYMNDEINRDAGFVITYIPNEMNVPYRAICADLKHEYFIRSGSSIYPLDRQGILDLIFRKVHPELTLEIWAEGGNRMWSPPNRAEANIELLIKIVNIGNILAKHYKLHFAIPLGIIDDAYGFYDINQKKQVKMEGIDYLECIYRNDKRQVPILPKDDHIITNKSEYAVYLKFKVDQFPEISERRIYWEIYADNAPPNKGDITIKSLLMGVKEFYNKLNDYKENQRNYILSDMFVRHEK